jgi:DNA repair exonuclease SbcCD ATPase subunit
MIQDTIAELEARIQKAESVKPESRAELLQLLSTLRSEIGALAETHREDAQSIASFATVSAQEALRQKRNPETMQHSLAGLSSSVAQFEKTHPNLVQLVNRICETLANLGI